MKMAESPVTVHTHTHTHNTYTKWVRCTKYLYSSWNSLTRLSILLQKKENTRENSLEKIGFDFDAIKKENINIKKVGYNYIEICS